MIKQILLGLFIVISYMNLDAQCTAERIKNPNLNGTAGFGWDGSDWAITDTNVTTLSGGGIFFHIDSQQNNNLSQTINNVNPQGNTSPVFTLDVGPYDALPPNTSRAMTFEMYYAGTLYMRISTLTGTSPNATVTYFNGASGNYSTIAMLPSGTSSGVTAALKVTLPSNVANSGSLNFRYNTTIGVPGDDITLKSVSLTTTIVTPTPTISAGGATTFCTGGSVTLTSSSATGNQWYKDGSIISGATGQTYTATTSGTYTVIATVNGCSSSASSGTMVTVNPIPPTPTISAGGATTFCAGGSVTLTSSSATGNQWYKDGSIIPGATAQSYIFNTSGTYTVIVTTSGCSSPASAGTTVTVNPKPSTPSISAGGATTFCTGGSVTLTSSSATGNQWYKDGSIIPGATAQSYIFNTSGTYTVIVTTNGCSSAASAGTTVTVNPTPPTPTISAGGATTFCTGGSVTLTSSSATGNQWYKDGSIIPGATAQSYIFNTSGTYTVIVTTSGCSSATSAGTTVTVNPTPPQLNVTAGGSTTFCTGGSVQLTADYNTTGAYQWYRNGTQIPGAISYQYTATTAGTYTVTRELGGCTSPASAGITVTVNPIPPVLNITSGGPTTFCMGGSVQLTADYNTTGAYQWYLNGATIPGAIFYQYTATTAGTYTVTRELGGCTSPASAGVSVTVNNCSFTCSGKIYSLDNNGEIRAFTNPLSSGALGTVINTTAYPVATTEANALGYSNLTNKFYYVQTQGGAVANNTFVSYDPITNTYQTLAGTNGFIYRGTVTNDGTGYYAITQGNTLKYYNISANTWTIITNNYVDQNGNNLNTILSTYNGGDIAMDGNGDLWILAGTVSSPTAYIFRVKNTVPTTSLGATPLVLEQIAKQDIGNSPNGIAFSAAGELLITNSTTLFKMNNNFSIASIGAVTNGASGDLASCAYPVNPFAISDFGDAPDTYKTLLTSNGAQHTVSLYDATNNTSALMIGSKIDLENDGFPNANADGDDTNNINDENSVTLPILTTVDTSYSITVPVVNSTGVGANIKAWIDFNKNGIFDAVESVTAVVANGATSVTLTWTGLSGLTLGDTYYRIRIAKASSEIANPTGVAVGGEVEDGKITISAPSYCTKPGDFSLAGIPTKVGITTQTKLTGWPENVPNGHITLESKEKGFVITRVAQSSDITDPKEGMIVYDIAAQCVKLYNGTLWKCIQRSCNN
ncbi:GEVED domain-containing protein [Chryseobacterium sp.]|uniref:beta strand repeat-containing protein n=1 Tax=Chryseobacterium sp. TaxID=1871047 RepID=UPI0024E27261|nr:GEVED domain-containing protein [Chryseobacterium sp.]